VSSAWLGQSFSEMFTSVIELSEKNPAKSSGFPENAHQHYRTFLKLSGKVNELFEKRSLKFPAFPEKKRG
jgi:hypothetical protein